ncbi:hypothetical protein SLS57_010707 [Botryosphaeria dothidea]
MSLNEYTEFLAAFPPGQASILLEDSNGHIHPVNGLDPDIVGNRAPLLRESFDGRPGGPLTLTLGVPSAQAGGAVIRFLYFGDYSLEDPDEPIEVKLLLHLEIFYVADYIECAELASLALGNLNLHAECSVSYSSPPNDLIPALIFAYAHLSEHQKILDTLLNYCVTVFPLHKLGDNPDFKRLAATHETLVVDLSKVNAERDFVSADIPKLAGPQRTRIQDADIANLFVGPILDNEMSDETHQPQSGPSYAEPVNLPLRIKCEAKAGELDLDYVFPTGPAGVPASPASTEDSFVICDKPGETDSDSDWSLV